jgi:hypothetical protein
MFIGSIMWIVSYWNATFNEKSEDEENVILSGAR